MGENTRMPEEERMGENTRMPEDTGIVKNTRMPENAGRAEGDLHTLLVVGIGWQFPPVQRGKRDMAQDTAPLIQRSGVEQIP